MDCIFLSAYLQERGNSSPDVLHSSKISPNFPLSLSNKNCKVCVLQFVCHCISRSSAQTRSPKFKSSLFAVFLPRRRFIHRQRRGFKFFKDTWRGTCPCITPGLIPRGFLKILKKFYSAAPPKSILIGLAMPVTYQKQTFLSSPTG